MLQNSLSFQIACAKQNIAESKSNAKKHAFFWAKIMGFTIDDISSLPLKSSPFSIESD